MNFKMTNILFFSPTKTTGTVLRSISKGIGSQVSELDFTFLTGSQDNRAFSADAESITVIGVPVYAGRVPALTADWLRSNVRGNGQPIVLVAVYGNRAYEDALLELKEISLEKGFVPVAGAAFIGEHSFSTPEKPIASGRPDAADLVKAEEFGRKVIEKLRAVDTLDSLNDLQLPGNVPHRNGVQAGPVAPRTIEDDCTLCGKCAEVCPVQVIEVQDEVLTDSMKCIRCCACVRVCPESARIFDNPNIKKVVDMLFEKHSVRKEPEIFFLP